MKSKIKRYELTIEYNTETEEIEYINEEIIDDDSLFTYGEIVLNNYFDEDSLKMLSDDHTLGVS
tara:strand:- start:673 stop:864 length:192 start_codon:yes stop_codon:yes gene_type:complete